jgi:ribonucleoside-diphosphate reductase alpha chain
MKAKGKQVDGMSCADIIARTIEQFIKPKVKTEDEAKNGCTNLEKCPECGEYGLTHQGGCNQCLSCGYTKCQ